MTENVVKFKVGDRIDIDQQEDVLVVSLRCSMCVALGNTEAVPTPVTRVWVPVLFERWIPRWEREKYISLEDAILKAPAYASLIKERNGRKEAERVCSDHGKMLRAAKIWTTQLSVIMEKQAAAADRRAQEAFGSIASLLGTPGAPKLEALEAVGAEGDVRRAEAVLKDAKASARRAKAAASETADPKDNGKGKKVLTKGRSNTRLQGEISEAQSQID